MEKTNINMDDNFAASLYSRLNVRTFSTYPYEARYLDDEMSIINEVICGYWKPRFLMDNKARTAVEFMDGREVLKTISVDDIDWESFKGLPDIALRRARSLSAHYPTFVRGYEDGVAEFSWQIIPDGMYYMDEDGYGMTDDEEVTLYGYIDRKGKPLIKLRVIESFDELNEMRRQALERIALCGE